ncbi:amidohydrolase [Paenibacillus yanchengensis]|uniref:5-methylthioadenosine/S-adenosylhomocysteine deaminase n=1 Tax=Paenibacillus yanchengensis TaxID=2035833 RepID=A0ABW4YK30_9BACL
MSQLWIKDGLFVTMNEQAEVIQGHMVVEDGVIVYLDKQTPPATLLHSNVEKVNGHHLVFMPGLINTHGHTPMSLLRGYSDDQNLQVWLEQKMWPMEAKYTEQDTHNGAAISQVEMLLSGTTTFVDMYDRMEIVAALTEQTGMRGVLTRGVIGLCSPAEQKQKLDDAIQFAVTWNGKADGRITTMLAPHAPYTCPPDYIAQFVEAAVKYQLPLHTHMSESRAEVEQNIKQYGTRPVEHLDALGFFSVPSLLAHAVHLTDEEIALLAAKDVAISHNVISNLKLASGVARLPELLQAGVRVSLGTDGPASNNNLNLFEEIRLAALLHKGTTYDPTVIPATEALKLGTYYGARSLRMEDSIGSLQVGKQADFIALNIDQPHYYPLTDITSHLVYTANGHDVQHVWVAGKQLVKDRQCLTLDVEKIKYEAQASFERLIEN